MKFLMKSEFKVRRNVQFLISMIEKSKRYDLYLAKHQLKRTVFLVHKNRAFDSSTSIVCFLDVPLTLSYVFVAEVNFRDNNIREQKRR